MMTSDEIENGVLPEVLFINAQGVRRRGAESLQALIQLKAIVFTKIMGLAHTANDRSAEICPTPENIGRRHFLEIPGSNSLSKRLQGQIFSDARCPSEQEAVVDFDFGVLHAAGLPGQDMVGIFGVEPMPVFQVKSHPLDIGVKNIDGRWPVEIEDGAALRLDPAAITEAGVLDDPGKSRRPCQTFYDLMQSRAKHWAP